MKLGEKLANLRLMTHQSTIIHTLSLIGESQLLFLVMGRDVECITGLQHRFEDLINQNIEVYLINQSSPAENLAYQQSQKLPFTLISDSNNSLLKVLGAKKTLLNHKPHDVFLFDTSGRLSKRWKQEAFDIDELFIV